MLTAPVFPLPYQEYFEHQKGHKVIWVLRNPYSVVYSMMNNWGRFAFNELFDACGVSLLNQENFKMYSKFGKFVIPKTKRACLSYVGKVSQLFNLEKELNKGSFKIIEYDNLVRNSSVILPEIYSFIHLEYKEEYSSKLHMKSLNKAQKLSKKQKELIDELCIPTYNNALCFANEVE